MTATATKTPARKVTPSTKEKASATKAKEAKATPLTTKQVAEELGTDPRTLRKMLRDTPSIANAGKGKRYEFTAKQIPSLRKGFEAWSAKEAKAREARAKKAAENPTDADLRARLEGMKVAELRGMLDAHGITYMKTSKKFNLIDRLMADRNIWA